MQSDRIQETLRQYPALIGRKDDFEVLTRHLAIAREGHTQVVLLTGDPGIGKTRLMEHLALDAVSRGMLVLRGGASEAEGMPPYLPFLEALGQHIRGSDPTQLREQTGPTAAVLATILLPELRLRLGDLPISYPLPPEQARLRLHEGIGMFLESITATQPLLLILDDLHWADPSSLELLCYIGRQQPALPMLVVGAYRAGEAEHEPALSRAVTELNRLRVLTTIGLGALSAADIVALAEAYLGGRVEAQVGDLLVSHSEGNPFFAEELLRSWVEAGALARRNQVYTLTVQVPTVSPGIVNTIDQRLRRLAPEVAELLQSAAVIGRTFDASLLADVAGQDAETVEKQLHQAVRAELIWTDQTGAFRFTHDKIRECLYEQVTALRRRRLHGFIGRALLEEQGEGDVIATALKSQRVADLAFHFVQSGDRARGVTYAHLAADQAMSVYAAQEAMAHYRVALQMIDARDDRTGSLLLNLGDAAMLAGAEPEAVRAFQAAHSWFRDAGDPKRTAQAAHRLGLAWWREERIPEARAALEDALTQLHDDSDHELVYLLVDLAGLLSVNLNEQSAGIGLARRALELAEQLQDDRLVAAACRTLGNLQVRANRLSEGAGLLERGLALSRAADTPMEAAECCAHLVGAHLWQGAMRQAQSTAQHWLGFAQRCHDPYQLRHVYVWLAYCHFFAGELSEGERWLERAREVVTRLAGPQPLAWFTYCRGGFAYMQGEYDLAERLMQEALTVFRETNPDALGWYMGFLCVIQAARGEVEEAHSSMEELEARMATLPEQSLPAATSLAYLTETALLLDDRERLERYHSGLMAFEGQFFDLLIDRLLGQIETKLENWPAGQIHLTSAEAMARENDLLWELAHTLEAEATFVLAQGGRGSGSRAGEFLREALGIYSNFGNAPQQRHVQERLGALAGRRSTRPLLPGGLSPREAEVLRLVAEGKTNRQIAHELVVSEKTVTNHLTSIFNKVGVDNRAGATAFAIRHHLA
jgi:DNA-binding CsgD family transcriptional regulator/tetratricopeptide (TPR) repeat protein